MIRTKREYHAALKRISDESNRFEQYKQAWQAEGYTSEQIHEMLSPLQSFQRGLIEETEAYESLLRGEFSTLRNLHGLGRQLIGLRIAARVSQADLAKRLGVSESQVSRDERNEYHGISVDRAARVLDALGVRMTSQVALPKDRNQAAG